MADWITVAGVKPYDGRYPLELEDITARELGWIKKLADTLPAGLWDGLQGGDAELVCVLAAIALRRAGKIEAADVPAVFDRLADGPYGSGITVETDAEEEDEAGPPPTRLTANGASSGAATPTSSENQADDQKPSGIPASDTSGSARPISAT